MHAEDDVKYMRKESLVLEVLASFHRVHGRGRAVEKKAVKETLDVALYLLERVGSSLGKIVFGIESGQSEFDSILYIAVIDGALKNDERDGFYIFTSSFPRYASDSLRALSVREQKLLREACGMARAAISEHKNAEAAIRAFQNEEGLLQPLIELDENHM